MSFVPGFRILTGLLLRRTLIRFTLCPALNGEVYAGSFSAQLNNSVT
jgi:hypothetical protein